VTPGEDGTFSHLFYLDFNNKVGNVLVSAQFSGDRIHLANETSAIYTVRVGTILERRDRTLPDPSSRVMPGDEVELSSKLFEDWGGFRGVEVQRELVALFFDGEFVDGKRTAFDGSVSFTVWLDPEVYRVGVYEVVFEFDGTDLYGGSSNVRMLSVGPSVDFGFERIAANGVPIDPETDVLRYGDEVHGRVVVKEGSGQPLAGITVTVSYREAISRMEWLTVGTGVTDGSGHMAFDITLACPRDEWIVLMAQVGDPLMDVVVTWEVGYIAPPQRSEGAVVDVLGDPRVEAGSTMTLDLVPANATDWDVGNLTFSLVSPPEGMVMSPIGSITWSPEGHQAGEHTITVWLFDGNRSETTDIIIAVAKKGSTGGDATVGILPWLVGAAVTFGVILLITNFMRGTHRSD
jgi:hypothetical protein